jgi:hypothetical protein
MIVKAPFINPLPPNPATARPMMSMVDDTAAPHRTDPTSKRSRKARNVSCSSLATDLGFRME